ncbi:histone deacetylase [Nocardia sp. NBC_01329]|uniref:histone deacetylase n=1 Tax=Nocardia sp. NBC_01329 TaxID=2903594 RepID=UPI002E14F205|nr:histone deacetylase [Nocardia sp. NBC_01329]
MAPHEIAVLRPRSALDYTTAPDRVWYATYGSNMDPDRLSGYLTGSGPADAVPTAPGISPGGCRDRTPPSRSLALVLPGLLYFATESVIWTGGRAFYDPTAPAETPVHAYLLTLSQFSDVAAQEMYRRAGTDLDLTEAVRTGRSRLGPGRYETLICPGIFDGVPVVTFTAPWRWREIGGVPPSAAYLRHIGTGLRAAHEWSIGETAGYLASRPGAAGHWTPGRVAELLSEETDSRSPR